MSVDHFDWIQGEKFIGLTECRYRPERISKDDHNVYPNTFAISSLQATTVVYTHTLYVKQFFKVVAPLKDNSFILITHNSDYNIDKSYKKPANVIKWWAQNVNIIDPDIESIPIGLENSQWHASLRKQEKMVETMAQPHAWKNLVYMNHNVRTNPKERSKPYKLLRGKSFVTTHEGYNGAHFDSYLDNLYNHHFMICPDGNGMDTHRVWECLYMGTIPIVKRNHNNRFYTEFPISFVDDWREITEPFLENEMARIEATAQQACWERLEFNYWKNKIAGSV